MSPDWEKAAETIRNRTFQMHQLLLPSASEQKNVDGNSFANAVSKDVDSP